MRRQQHHQDLRARARDLRKNPTRAEAKLWSKLRKKQLAGRKFRRQHILAPFIVDFYCCSRRLAIEIDGVQHDEAADQRRSVILIERYNIEIIRFRDYQVHSNIGAVIKEIHNYLKADLSGT